MPTCSEERVSKTPMASWRSLKATTATSWRPRLPSTSSKCRGSWLASTIPNAPRPTRSWACIRSVRPSRAPKLSRRHCWRSRWTTDVYVIVVGGGTVGYYMSRDLLERGHEVTLIERDARRADWLESQLGSIVMRGDGCEVKFLSQTGIERADAIVAVTADDEDNLIALQMAKRHFKVKKTIARVNNPSNVEIFKTLGVDEAVSATEVLLGALEPPITT